MKMKARIFIPKAASKAQTKSTLVELARNAARLNKKMIELSIDRGKDIVTGGNFAHIKDSTKYIRSVVKNTTTSTKPLVETGEMRNSVMVVNTPDGAYVELGASYGLVHNEAHQIPPSKFSIKFHTVGKAVPRRRFFGTPKAFFRREEFRALQRESRKKLKETLLKSTVKTIN